MDKIIDSNRAALIALCQLHDIKNMYVFGSAANGNFGQQSDIDILISFKDDISIERYTDNYFALHEKLEKLFNRKIDLVTEKSLKNPYLIESIQKSRKLLYAA